MKIKEIRGIDKTTLDEKKLELKKELIKLNAQVALGTALKNPGQVRKFKKTLARLITVEHENKNNNNLKPKLNTGVGKKTENKKLETKPKTQVKSKK